MSSDDELEREQARLDAARRALAAMRERTATLLSDLRAAGKPDLDLEATLSHRLTLLAETSRPLFFGRTDHTDGTRWYIGRRHVEDAAANPLVIEWRVPAATPFYRARPGDPLGLERRRQFMVDGTTVTSFADDLFGELATPGEQRLRGGDALLAELERTRAGEMVDIVATIQVEQDEVVRAPLPGILAVQGGPGTGKTAIGLHRAAYLLYNHPELAQSGVLVVGPSRTFIRYIGQVLPSLGETAVVQVALADLVHGVVATIEDDHEVARLKGDLRAGALVAAALANLRGTADADLVVDVGVRRISVAAGDVNAIAERIAARGGPYRSGRAALRVQLLSAIHRRVVSAAGADVDKARLDREVRAQPGFDKVLDACWPAVSAKGLVGALLSDRRRLAAAASGVFSDQEWHLLLRKRAAGRTTWTSSDLPLVDEAEWLIAGRGRTFGHVVADEAQDLTPMQVRMLARRNPAASFTVLGDLAQATGPFTPRSWEEATAPLACAARGEEGFALAELSLGYRAPATVLELASRLLPEAAPGIVPTEAVRPGRTPASIMRVSPDELAGAVAFEAARLGEQGFYVGCIVPDGNRGAVLAALRRQGTQFGIAERDGLLQPITVVTPRGAKGLEFDAAVVVEPAEIAGQDPTGAGLRLLYVCLTRPIQHLTIVHSADLPAGLADTRT
jgi:DNA helicase IV